MSNMIIPEDLKILTAQKPQSAILNRENICIFPTGDTTVTSNTGTIAGNYLEFRLPAIANKSYDCATLFIHFNFKINLTNCSKVNATDKLRVFVHDSIESIFKAVYVYLGSSNQQLEYIENYNALETALNFYVNDNFVKTMGSVCMASGLTSHQRCQIYTNQANNNVTALTTAHTNTVQFSVPLRLSGLANPNVILPSSLFSGLFATIRIELESPQNCIFAGSETVVAVATTGIISGGVPAVLTSASTSLTYTLSNIRMTIDVITYDNEYSVMLNNALASSRLSFPIKTWDIQVRNVPTGTSRFTENLAFNYSNVDAIFIWFNRATELQSFIKSGKDRLVYPSPAGALTPYLNNIQFKINGVNYPQGRPIDCSNNGTEAYVHLIEALGQVTNIEQIGSSSYSNVIQTFSGVNNATAATPFFGGSVSQLGGDPYFAKNKPETSILALNGHDIDTNVYQAYSSAYNTDVGLTVANRVNHDTQSGMLCPYINEMSPSRFMIGINVKKVLRENLGETSGMNLQQSAGMIGYELNFSANTTEAYSMYVAVLHNRFVELEGTQSFVRV